MLSRMEYRLKPDAELSFQMSSLFHGALINLIPDEYKEQMHESRMHPYAQHLERRDRQWYWIINSLNEEIGQILTKSFSGVQQIELQKHGIKVELELSATSTRSNQEMNTIFYQGKGQRYFRLQFLTPTSFKRQGEYLIYPDLYCIFQSLMNRMEGVSSVGIYDEDALEELARNAKIVRYQLRSTSFSLEGVTIPSFLGNITIRLGGTRTMSNFAEMLLRFGEYSGVGIKTSIGMGAFALMENSSFKHSGRMENKDE